MLYDLCPLDVIQSAFYHLSQRRSISENLLIKYVSVYGHDPAPPPITCYQAHKGLQKINEDFTFQWATTKEELRSQSYQYTSTLLFLVVSGSSVPNGAVIVKYFGRISNPIIRQYKIWRGIKGFESGHSVHLVEKPENISDHLERTSNAIVRISHEAEEISSASKYDFDVAHRTLNEEHLNRRRQSGAVKRTKRTGTELEPESSLFFSDNDEEYESDNGDDSKEVGNDVVMTDTKSDKIAAPLAIIQAPNGSHQSSTKATMPIIKRSRSTSPQPRPSYLLSTPKTTAGAKDGDKVRTLQTQPVISRTDVAQPMPTEKAVAQKMLSLATPRPSKVQSMVQNMKMNTSFYSTNQRKSPPPAQSLKSSITKDAPELPTVREKRPLPSNSYTLLEHASMGRLVYVPGRPKTVYVPAHVLDPLLTILKDLDIKLIELSMKGRRPSGEEQEFLIYKEF